MNRTQIRFAIYAGTALGVFWLPFQVPPLGIVFSVSQAFHFNNQAAIAALLVGMALATWWSWRNPSDAPLTPSPPDQPDQQLSWRPLLVTLGVSGLWLTLVGLATVEAPQLNGIYFVNRLFCLQAGWKPYRDFEFAYGPAMLYVPVVLRNWTGLSVNAAYMLALWMFAWGGLFLLWWVVRQVHAPKHDQIVAFLLVAAFPAINPECGIEYTLTRYAGGLAALVAARIAVEKLPRRWLAVAVCHLILVAAVFSISPEVGLAFLAALIVYWFLEYRAGSTWLIYTAATHVAVLAGLALLAPRNAFLSVRGFGAGSNHLPLFPSPYNLLYVGTLLVAVAPILSDAVRAVLEKKHGFGVFGTLTAPFAVHALAMMPAALGRADAGHVVYNGTAVFLLALLMPIRKTPWAISGRFLYRGVFFLVFPIMTVALDRALLLPMLENRAILQAVKWSEDHPFSLAASGLEKALGEEQWSRRLNNLTYMRQASLENQFPGLSGYGPICEPIGLPDILTVLGTHGALQPEYYFSLTDESPAPAVSRKVADLRTCQYAIVPRGFLGGLPPVVRLNTGDLSRLLMFPVETAPEVAPPNRPFFDYLKNWFIPLRPVAPGMYLCTKRPDAP
jgi:hypothetical protein